MANSLITPEVICKPQGGSIWHVLIPGHDRIVVAADRRPDGTVYVRTPDDSEDVSLAGVDPADAESWDIDYAEFDEALREYFDLGEEVKIRL